MTIKEEVTQAIVLSEAEKLDIWGEITKINDEVRRLDGQNRQDLIEDGLGIRNREKITQLIEEKKKLYHKLGLVSPEEKNEQVYDAVIKLMAINLSHQARSGGSSTSRWAEDGEAGVY